MNIDRICMLGALVMITLALLFGESQAASYVQVNTATGDDSSADPWQTDSPVLTYARAIQLGADGDSIGIMFVGEPPSTEEAEIIMRNKPDLSNSKTQRFIDQFGYVDDCFIAESELSGLRIKRRIVWRTYTAINGREGIESAGMEETVESY